MHEANPISRTIEGGGHVLTCVCGWTRFYTAQPDADSGRLSHAAKCKGPKSKPEPKATKRASSAAAWADRGEGSSWIDQL